MWYPDKYTCNINLSGRRGKGECKQAKILLSSLFLFLWMECMKLVNLPRIVVYLIGLRFKKEGGDNTHFMWVSMPVKKKKRRSRLILLFSSIISVSVVGQVILCVWTNASFSRNNVEWYGVFFLHYLYDNNFLFVRRPMWRNENVFWERNENSSISLILVAWFANYKNTFCYSCNGGFE